MPVPPKRQGPTQQGGMFGSLLDDMLGSGVNRIFQTVRQYTPKCAICGASTIFRCQSCGTFVCNTHGFINAQAWDKYTTVCSRCMSQHFDFVQVAPPNNWYGNDDEQWPYDQDPLEILDLTWQATPKEINDQFRKKAKLVHPDRASDEDDRRVREEQMKILTAARDWLLRKHKSHG
jgi:hypothetical protein